ncbi:hypothetical protein M0802_000710 [Mischocyttarus mexicanus]|nr:hypothetical protein M0802_000710 [Mischocyttarus mexicanus]
MKRRYEYVSSNASLAVPVIVTDLKYALLIPTLSSKLVTALNLQVLLELNFPPVGYNLSNDVLTLSLNLTDTVESIRDIQANFLTALFLTTVAKLSE